MFVQWCLKGMRGDDDGLVDHVFARGIWCNWWHNRPWEWSEVPDRLTAENLDHHINDYFGLDALTGVPFYETTPFISLTAGAVDRQTLLRRNALLSAHETALEFATAGGRRPGYIFRCWVIVGLNPAPAIEQVAEETRELNSTPPYSDWQLEGEVTAKLRVPAASIEACEKYEPRGAPLPQLVASWRNGAFVAPDPILMLREAL